ncbi:MAG TPA: hypothetical protein VEK57_02720 [Thermoanaerobaculia bacterium]|nr:hypothetical protein [Thermoanaerobaculia bacterium]
MLPERPGNPEEHHAGSADGQAAQAEPAVLREHRRGGAQQEKAEEEEIEARAADAAQRERPGKQRGRVQDELLRDEEAVELEREERRDGKHDRYRAGLKYTQCEPHRCFFFSLFPGRRSNDEAVHRLHWA